MGAGSPIWAVGSFLVFWRTGKEYGENGRGIKKNRRLCAERQIQQAMESPAPDDRRWGRQRTPRWRSPGRRSVFWWGRHQDDSLYHIGYALLWKGVSWQSWQARWRIRPVDRKALKFFGKQLGWIFIRGPPLADIFHLSIRCQSCFSTFSGILPWSFSKSSICVPTRPSSSRFTERSL